MPNGTLTASHARTSIPFCASVNPRFFHLKWIDYVNNHRDASQEIRTK
jgi:hypothetical protein